jgi:hypothetical protein
MSSRSLRSVRGRLEYDAIGYAYAAEGYCKLRLNLFDLPTGAIVTIHTTGEQGTHRWYQQQCCRAYRVPVWQQSYTEELTLRSQGTLRIQVYTKKHIHSVEYRIDPKQRRPIRQRQQRSLLELYVEDHFYDLEAMKRFVPRQEKSMNFPPGSLWRQLPELYSHPIALQEQ